MKEFVDAVKRLVDLMPSGAALPHFYARDELVKVRELLGEVEKSSKIPITEWMNHKQEGNWHTVQFTLAKVVDGKFRIAKVGDRISCNGKIFTIAPCSFTPVHGTYYELGACTDRVQWSLRTVLKYGWEFVDERT